MDLFCAGCIRRCEENIKTKSLTAHYPDGTLAPMRSITQALSAYADRAAELLTGDNPVRMEPDTIVNGSLLCVLHIPEDY